MVWGVAQIADLVVIIVNFLQKLEEIIDPEEKSLVEDKILQVIKELAERFDSD